MVGQGSGSTFNHQNASFGVESRDLRAGGDD